MRRLRVLVRKGLEQEIWDRLYRRPPEEGESIAIKVKTDGKRTVSEREELCQRACRILEALARQQGYGLYFDAAEVLVDGVRLVVRRKREEVVE